MQQTLMVLFMALILSGCLSKEESSTNGGNNPPSNSSPTITGSPSLSVLYGNMYVFQPNASDPDGDALTFQIENGPSWADFDTLAGRLSGQPTLADVGVYQNVVISVSDGTASSSIPAFSITVSQSASGSITLSWVAPTQNVDGSALVDLAGYKIYYGRSSGSYETEIRIDGVGLTTFVVDQLSPDTYYFATTAFNTSDIESTFSGEAVGTVF